MFAAAAVLVLLGGCAANVAGGPQAATSITGSGTSGTSGTRGTSTAQSSAPSVTGPATVTVTATVAPSGSAKSRSTPSSSRPKTTVAATSSTKKWKLPNPKPTSPTNSFGDIKAVPGQAYGVFFSNKTTGKDGGAVVFVVSKLTLDPKCPAGVPKATHGHYLKIDLEVEPRELTKESLDSWSGSFNANGWTVFATDGTAETGTDDSSGANECSPNDQLPYIDNAMLANAPLIKGSVVLDVGSAKGTVVLGLGLQHGWEYSFG